MKDAISRSKFSLRTDTIEPRSWANRHAITLFVSSLIAAMWAAYGFTQLAKVAGNEGASTLIKDLHGWVKDNTELHLTLLIGGSFFAPVMGISIDRARTPLQAKTETRKEEKEKTGKTADVEKLANDKPIITETNDEPIITEIDLEEGAAEEDIFIFRQIVEGQLVTIRFKKVTADFINEELAKRQGTAIMSGTTVRFEKKVCVTDFSRSNSVFFKAESSEKEVTLVPCVWWHSGFACRVFIHYCKLLQDTNGNYYLGIDIKPT